MVDGYADIERKLYYRVLIARFGYHKNIIRNMGEENGAAPFWQQVLNDKVRFSMIRYLKDHDPYKNPLVLHTMWKESYRAPNLESLLGFYSLDGLFKQVAKIYDVHPDFLYWIAKAKKAQRLWVMMIDEIGRRRTSTDDDDSKHDTLRREVLWGTFRFSSLIL